MKRTKEYEEFLMITGEIIIEYTKAEIACSMIVNSITESNQGYDIYSNKKLNAGKKIIEFKNSIKKIKHERKTDIMALFGKLNQCRLQRNEFAHTIWNRYPIRDKHLMYGIGTDNNTGKPTIKKIGNEEATKILNRVKEVSNSITLEFAEFHVFNQMIKGIPRTLKKKALAKD